MTLSLCHDLRKRRASSAAPPLFSSFLSGSPPLFSLYQRQILAPFSLLLLLFYFLAFALALSPEFLPHISASTTSYLTGGVSLFSWTLSNPNNSPIEITAYPAIMNSLVATPPVPPHFYEPPRLSPSRPSKLRSGGYTLNSRSVVADCKIS